MENFILQHYELIVIKKLVKIGNGNGSMNLGKTEQVDYTLQFIITLVTLQ